MRAVALMLALSAALCWGIGGILLKKGLAHISPATFLALQYLLGGVAVLIWLAARGELSAGLHAIGQRWLGLLGVVVLQVAGYIFFVVAIGRAGAHSLPTATVIAIAASYPALVAVLSGPILGEQLGWNDAVGVALIVSGVVVTQLR
jgi:drug/metabolite transporter (DMT)-like permease